MKNAVIYARFSSHAQNEQSIEGQLAECRAFAERNNLRIVREYIDRALTGTTDKRPDFLQMIEDSKRKGFQFVIVYQLDRFARNRYDSATYKAKLKKNGVRVLSAKENITDDASGILIEGVLESMAEYYSAECFYGHNFTDVFSNIRFIYLELPQEWYLTIRFYTRLNI